MLYTVVIPCYKSSATIRKVVEMTSEELTRLGRTPYEFVLVDDCSPDGGDTLAALTALSRDYDYVKTISLAKNSGQHNAVMAGLNYAQGEYIIAMDDDMQTHPSQLHFLLDEIDKGYDIVYGYYPKKKHSGFRNLGSYLNYLTVRILIGKPRDMKTSSYWVIRRFVRDYVIQYQNPYTHLQGLFLRTTRNISCIPIQHFEREVGESGYTFSKLVQLYSNIMGYSVVPLRLSTYCGYLFSAISILGGIAIIIRKLMVPTMEVGWPSMMVAICFFGGLIMLFLGLIGEYLGRMFLGMNRQPQFVVRNVITQDSLRHEGPKPAQDDGDSSAMHTPADPLRTGSEKESRQENCHEDRHEDGTSSGI